MTGDLRCTAGLTCPSKEGPQSDMSKADLMGSRVMPRGVGEFSDGSVAPLPLQSSLYAASSCCCSARALPGSIAMD